MRDRRPILGPLATTIVMMALIIALMVWWIVAFAATSSWAVLTLGTIAFALVLIGLSYYFFLTLKERQIRRRQMNFVDSVTHELKTPIASMRLYLETLKLRQLAPEKRSEFYETIDSELKRLDEMIDQLLQVARLDAIGQGTQPSDVQLDSLLTKCAKLVCNRHRLSVDNIFSFDVQPYIIRGPQIALEMIFGNLFDNAIKYGGDIPKVEVSTRTLRNDKVEIKVVDHGEGIPVDHRKKIFQLFYRVGDELERKQKGAGVGLHIVQTLVRKLGGRIIIEEPKNESGSIFKVELPGKLPNEITS